MDVDRADTALGDYLDLDVERFRHRPILARCRQLRPNLTVYDASHVALAELLGVTLLTADRRLAGATGPTCAIELVS